MEKCQLERSMYQNARYLVSLGRFTTLVQLFLRRGGSDERDRGSSAASDTHYMSSTDPTRREGFQKIWDD